MKVDVGGRLKMLRKEWGLTQKELALRVSGGIDYTYIGKIERGEQLPSLKILLDLAKALDVPVFQLLGESEKPTPLHVERLFRNTKGDELAKALSLLREEDIPLVIEMINSIVRHRRAKKAHESPEDENLLAAEKYEPYGKK